MRLRIVGLLVAFGALLAACGGGGKSVLPSIAQPPAASSATPGQQATKRMAVVLNIPPASKQSKARRPFYVSPNTQSIVFAVVPNGSGTPTPSELQVFPVTTPSPCATTSAGGESCTFNVTAPFGTDIFYVATFAVASPNPASTIVPLASFVSGAIVVASPSPGVTPSPLAFTLNGVVYSVAVSVPSPDPSNSPNTQVLVAASPTSLPLGITPYDSSGAPILSDTFLAPIPLIVTPQGEGVGLTMTPTCSTSTGNATPSPVVAVGCAADLGNVKISYPGTIFADTSDHIVDTFSIAASQQASPAPSPANVVLASNVTSFAPSGASSYNVGYLQALPSNTMAYLLANTNSAVTTAQYGTFDVSTGATLTQSTLTATTATGFYVMSDGSIWVTNGANDSLLCFAPGATTPTLTTPLASYMTYAGNVTFDGANIWVGGSMSTSDIVAYAPLTSSCTIGSLSATALPGDAFGGTQTMALAPRSGGGVLVNDVANGGAWTVIAGGAATQLNTYFTPGTGFGGGVGVDGTGQSYFAFRAPTQNFLSTLPNGGTSFNGTTLTLPTVQFGALAAFGPNSGAADRIGLVDATFNTLIIIEGPNATTPVIISANLGNVQFGSNGENAGQNVAISTGGAGFISYVNASTAAVNIARTYFTTTWWVPVTTLSGVNSTHVLGIDERGDSGPFTLTPISPPACYSGSSLVTGTDHSFLLGNTTSSPCTVTLKISDKNGRSQTVTVTIPGFVG